MKKRLCTLLRFLLCLPICLLSACGRGQSSVQPVTDGFTCRVAMTFDGLSLSGQLSRTEEGRLLLTLAEPASLSGMALAIDGSKLTMELGGMSISVDPERVPHGALIACLQRALSATSATVRRDDGLTLEVQDGDTQYTLVCDPATGLPRTLTAPQEGLEVQFSDVQLLTPVDNAGDPTKTKVTDNA